MINFSDGSRTFQALVALVFIIATIVLILNCCAIIFLLKGSKGIHNNSNKNSFDEDRKNQNQQQHHKKTSTGAQRNALILLSLCVANVLFGAGVLVDFTCFVADQYFWAGAYVLAFGLITSLIHVCMLTTERFIAVKFPFKYQVISVRVLTLISVMVWSVSVLSAIAVRIDYKVFLTVLFIVLIISDVGVFVVYIIIVASMRKLNNNRRYTVNQSPLSLNQQLQDEQQNRITIFCAIIVISYMASTVPSVIWYLVHSGGYISPYSGKTVDIVLFMLLLLRSLTDPLIYIFREGIHTEFSSLYSKFTDSLGNCNCFASTTRGKEDVELLKSCTLSDEESKWIFLW